MAENSAVKAQELAENIYVLPGSAGIQTFKMDISFQGRGGFQESSHARWPVAEKIRVSKTSVLE